MSLSVLGQLTEGNNICFLEREALYPQPELFLFAQITVLKLSSVNLTAMFVCLQQHSINTVSQFLSTSKTILPCLTLSMKLEKQPHILTHMDTWYVWEPQKLYCCCSLMIYCTARYSLGNQKRLCARSKGNSFAELLRLWNFVFRLLFK